jgi:DNA polymerase-3 subunit beta
MKFIATQSSILEGVSRVSALAGRNPQLPILQNILMEVREGVLHLTCTDLEVGAHVLVTGKAERDGSCVVPARQLLEYVQQLPSLDPIVFDYKKEGLKVSTNKFNARFPVTTADDFPLLPMPQKKNEIIIDGRLFCQGVSNTLFSAARDETRPELHSVFVSSGGGSIRIAATDSFRLSEQIIPLGSKKKFSFLLPVNAAQEIVRLFGGTEELGLLIEQNYVAFRGGGCDLSTRLIDGTYPNYRQIIPDKFGTSGVVECDEVLRALKTLAVFLPRDSRRVSVVVVPDKGLVYLKVEGGESGSGEVEVEFEGKGKEVELLFNVQYLLEGFQHLAGKKCEVLLGGESDPLLVRPHDSSVKQLYVVMPIQL